MPICESYNKPEIYCKNKLLAVEFNYAGRQGSLLKIRPLFGGFAQPQAVLSLTDTRLAFCAHQQQAARVQQGVSRGLCSIYRKVVLSSQDTPFFLPEMEKTK
jgi:hypothetical protein